MSVPKRTTAMIRVTLVDLLRERGISQRELARRTDTHPDVVSRFARQATTGVSYELLDRICAALNCQPRDLLGFEPEQISLFASESSGTDRHTVTEPIAVSPTTAGKVQSAQVAETRHGRPVAVEPES